jgi:hypothetical protein
MVREVLHERVERTQRLCMLQRLLAVQSEDEAPPFSTQGLNTSM